MATSKQIQPEAEHRRKKRFFLKRREKRIEQRGMTLIEIMVVIIIMAMIATGVSVAVMRQSIEAKKRTAKTDVMGFGTAAMLYVIQNSGECPDTGQLIEGGYLNPKTRTRDPWNQEFSISCDGDEIDVISSGPDKLPGTEDDIR